MKFERLGNIVLIKKGKKPDIIESPEEDSVRVIQIDDLRNDNILKYTNEKSGVFANEEDILIAWDGANAGTIGYGKTGYIGSTIALLRKIEPKKYSTSFIGKFLQSKFETLRSNTTGATIPHIDRKTLDNLKIPVISYFDQLHISNILSCVEKLITQRKQSIRLLDEYLKNTFLEKFGDFEKFELIDLVSICNSQKDIKCGPFGTQLKNSEYQTKGVPLWNITDVNKHFINKPKEFLTTKKAKELEQYNLLPFDIVITRKATVGNASIYPSDLCDGIMHSDLLRIRFDRNKVVPLFILYQFHYSKFISDQIKKVSGGAVTQGINVTKLKKLNVIVPQIEQQNQFAQIVLKTEALKIRYKSSLQELENLYKSLSQKAFKGELRANEDEMSIAAEPQEDYHTK